MGSGRHRDEAHTLHLDLSLNLSHNCNMKLENLYAKVQKGDLKAKMFEYLRKVEETGEPLLVTDHGTPTVVIYPYYTKLSVEEIFGPFRSKFKAIDDVKASENEEWGDLS